MFKSWDAILTRMPPRSRDERKDILLARPRRHNCPGLQRLHGLCYRRREAIAIKSRSLRYRVVPHHQGGEDGGGPWRHQDNAVELAGVQQGQHALRQPGRRQQPGKGPAACSVKPLACSADFRSKATVSPARCTSAPAFGLSVPAIRRDNSSPVPGPAVTSVKPSSVAAFAVASPTAKSGSFSAAGEVAVRGKRAQGIAAGHDQGLRALELERHVVAELDDEQRREHRLMAARGEASRPGGWRRVQACVTRRRISTGEASQEIPARQARAARSPASAPMLAAFSGAPLSSISCHSLPSGVRIRPRKRKHAVGDLGETGDRRPARAVEARKEGALAGDGRRRCRRR